MSKAESLISIQTTSMRLPIPAAAKLSCALRFLVTGESYQNLRYQFRASKSAMSGFVPDVADVIYQVLKDLKCPSTAEEWEVVAAEFERRWQFPNCIGAGDGKYIKLRRPPGSGSTLFNYKHFYSIVLFGITK